MATTVAFRALDVGVGGGSHVYGTDWADEVTADDKR